MTVFFTADTHFGHAGALSLYQRPFGSVAEMNAAMIGRWNETVGPDDDVWHLGDFALRTSVATATDLLRTLNGRKHLVTGNNDAPEIVALPQWRSTQSYIELIVNQTRLVLCHYAFRTWNGMAKGALNLHGHSHGRLKPLPRQTDVGVDAWSFRPITLDRLRGRRSPGHAM
ncbi:metallophosphoesterase family protein [Rhodopila sp.]|uniref:metallophosphoesterase family protein n=1 Tax=Rhodopila sp. TaxID=2480087 RepID=UPI003D0AE4FC